MKKLISLTMPLLMTAAFSFSGIAGAENASATLSISQNATQTTPLKATDASLADVTPFIEKVPAKVEAVQDQTSGDAETSIASLPKLIATEKTNDETASETVIEPESEAEPDFESEDKPEAQPEPAEPDPFASDPYARSSLKDIEEHFAQSRALAQKSREFGNRARAIIAGSSDNRNFRRHCEYLTRAVNNNIYAANAALLALPRLLEVSNLICETSIKTLMGVFTDELIREPLAREMRLSEMRNLLDSQAEISRLLRNLSQQTAFFCLEAKLQSSRRHVQGRIPEFLRAANRDMVNLITRQNGHLETLLNQFEHHYQFCLVNIDYFFAVSDNAPGVMQGAQLGRILRSCQDFSFSLRNYRDAFTVFAEQFTKQIEARSQGIEGLIGNKSRHVAKIAEFTDNYPARDLDDMPEETFSAQETLQQIWNLLATIRDQAGKIAADKASAASSEESEAEKEESATLLNTLYQHLDSKNWAMPDFLAPREKLKEELAEESDNNFETDVAEKPDNKLENDSTDNSANDLEETEKNSADSPDGDLAKDHADVSDKLLDRDDQELKKDLTDRSGGQIEQEPASEVAEDDGEGDTNASNEQDTAGTAEKSAIVAPAKTETSVNP